MESDSTSSTQTSSAPVSDHSDPPLPGGFSITREDAQILSEYVDEFQEGDANHRANIIANAMAALIVLRPDAEPFNKGEASKVKSAHIISSNKTN